ncbi:ribonuclease III [Paraneptunicella aestuarii]|uniref:ribonuclease III n=1 Tax=Paraneptunicella aestuarii TaxID=2831148 RepID=UPI001E29C0AE|nr:ribonuclease III [Paraneptunicella aestuarii]UAA40075.1 ribonuclease III [Paraneptunicella aestuarii]
MDKMRPYIQLCDRIGYHFKDMDNMMLALTHRSASSKHNERLEFLGDAVLGMIVARILYDNFPNVPEGKLTRMRSSLVKGETLAKLAKQFDFGDVLQLGAGELKSGGFSNSSILADAFEALLGAIYLESGLDTCFELVKSWFGDRIGKLDPDFHPKDSKTQLQEYLQGKHLPLPDYEVVDIKGKSHDQTFYVTCKVNTLSEPVSAMGKSRRKAEQEAARLTLEKLKNAE